MENFQNTQPIYLQIIARIKRQIATKELVGGTQLASVRDLAMNYQVNPNTVQRALSELERDGLVRSDRTVGRFVTDDQALIDALHQELFLKATENYVSEVNALHIAVENVLLAIEKQMKRGEDND